MKNKCDFLNVMRFSAFLSIFLLHSIIFSPLDWSANIDYIWIIHTPAWAGVWIFFILSGYGIGHGFYTKKYKMSLPGIVLYATQRFAKVIPLYYLYILIVFIFFAPERLVPDSKNIYNLAKLLLFQYNESFGSLEFGAVWFLSTLMKLYLIAPVVFYLSERFLTSNKRVLLALCLLVAFLFLFRIGWLLYIIKSGNDVWSKSVYKPFYMNLDLFFGGFFLNKFKFIKSEFDSKLIFKVVGVICFFGLLIFNSYIYYLANYNNARDYMYFYQYVCPTLYLIVSIYNIFIFDIFRSYKYTPLSYDAFKHNFLRIFDCFPIIMLPCYLFHSAILRQMQGVIHTKYTLKITNLLFNFGIRTDNVSYINLAKHLISSFLSFFITLLLGFIIITCIKQYNGARSASWISRKINAYCKC